MSYRVMFPLGLVGLLLVSGASGQGGPPGGGPGGPPGSNGGGTGGSPGGAGGGSGIVGSTGITSSGAALRSGIGSVDSQPVIRDGGFPLPGTGGGGGGG